MLLFYINNFDIIWIGQNVAMGKQQMTQNKFTNTIPSKMGKV